MNVNAISVANHLIDKANEDNVELRQFGLMKRVYIVHGFCLAILNRSALDPRFDWVEAWDNGPVIPSVYHSFKYNKNHPIREKSCIANIKNGKYDIRIPSLEDADIKTVADAVWTAYLEFDDFRLVAQLHNDGTPWQLCYEKGKNNKIPDLYTKVFYKKAVENGRNP